MSAPKTDRAPREWPGAHTIIILRNGRRAHYLGKCEVTGKKRCRVFVKDNPDHGYTTWLLDDTGACGVAGRESEHDWLGELAA